MHLLKQNTLHKNNPLKLEETLQAHNCSDINKHRPTLSKLKSSRKWKYLKLLIVQFCFWFWATISSLRQNIFVWLFEKLLGTQGLYTFFLNLNLIYKNSDIVLWINYELGTRESTRTNFVKIWQIWKLKIEWVLVLY